MSLGAPDYTRRAPIVEGHDPHPNLKREDFDRIVERNHENFGVGAELSAHAEIMQDRILQQMAQAQTAALRASAVEAFPELEGKTDAEIVEFVNALQVSADRSEQVAYLSIVNNSIAQAARTLEAAGVTSNSLGAAITRAAASAGHNLSGAATDLSHLSTTGILTIAGVGFGTFILTGNRGLGLAFGGIATAIQSPHLTDAAINLFESAGRLTTQAVALPTRGAMRTTEMIAGLGQDGLLEIIEANAAGFGNDVINSIAYTLDGDYKPNTNPNSNVLLAEFLRLGEVFAPVPLQPMIKYLLAVRNGGPITIDNLPSRAELEAAGAFLRQAEHLVSPDEFIAIEARRLGGAELTNEQKQQYILGKYMMLMNQNFLGQNARDPQASIVRAAYEGTNGTLTLAQALPLSPELQAANLSWTPQQRANFENNIAGMEINLVNLTKYGAAGLALNLYFSLTFALMAIQVGKGAWDANEERIATKASNRQTPDNLRTLSSRQLSRLRTSLSDNTNQVSGVVTALVSADVLHNNSDFSRELRNRPLSAFTDHALTALITAANGDTSSRETLRNAFFTFIESGTLDTTETDNQAQRRDFYRYQNVLNRIGLFYQHDPRGTSRELQLGGRTFTIGKPARGQFTFTTVRDLAGIANPLNFYNYMTNRGDGRTLRMQNQQGNIVNLQIRREGTAFQFNAADGSGWQTLDLTALETSLAATSGGVTPAAPSA